MLRNFTGELISEGKTKRLYEIVNKDGLSSYIREKVSINEANKITSVINNMDVVLVEFKDDVTAGNGAKKDNFNGKGKLCNLISYKLTKSLTTMPSCIYAEDNWAIHVFFKKKDILPLEVVFRFRAAGSFCKRYGVKKYKLLTNHNSGNVEPLIEFFVKDDELGDPLIDIIAASRIYNIDVNELLKVHDVAINTANQLYAIFASRGLELIDGKFEIGMLNTEDGVKYVIIDEISPDTLRIVKETNDGYVSLDKDVFRETGEDITSKYEYIYKLL